MSALEEAVRYILAHSTPQPNGCRLWRGPRGGGVNSYGKMNFQGVIVGVHRIICAHTHGLDLDGDWHARHSCDTPPCVEHSHLLPGTPADNVRDRDQRGRRRTHRQLMEHIQRMSTEAQ